MNNAKNKVTLIPVTVDTDLPLVRHMTLDQYVKDVAPLVKEFRGLLKKKFYIKSYNSDFGYCSYSDYIEHVKGIFYSGQGIALTQLGRAGIKENDAPEELTNRLSELQNILATVFDVDMDSLRVSFDINTPVFEKTHKMVVRYALEEKYITDIIKGDLNLDQLEDVCASVGVKVPKRVYELKNIGLDEYKRSLSPVNKAFLETFDKSLEPCKEELKARRKSQIDELLTKHPIAQGQDIPSDYYDEVKNYQDLAVLYKIAYVGYEEAVKFFSDRYVSDMLLLFVSRVASKLNNLNDTLKDSSFKVNVNDASYINGIIEASAVFTYGDAVSVKCDSKLIIAGGFVQREHYRYLTNFWINGTKANQERIDNFSL
ncbi:hypothetical protein [Photobacterium kishitanii]|uniref:Uncharacterized protein n=1 Tax=Photobacterium kishitanii TaxID=318456 RepID=A0A2T3KLE7_9GAMM|nr:hypothetical protein [Photobacterium kishitanii]PSV00496.1 hypothetical protein C9J27_05010 [Photobacterium kishitanii]